MKTTRDTCYVEFLKHHLQYIRFFTKYTPRKPLAKNTQTTVSFFKRTSPKYHLLYTPRQSVVGCSGKDVIFLRGKKDP
jgi:hypothetical protein